MGHESDWQEEGQGHYARPAEIYPYSSYAIVSPACSFIPSGFDTLKHRQAAQSGRLSCPDNAAPDHYQFAVSHALRPRREEDRATAIVDTGIAIFGEPG